MTASATFIFLLSIVGFGFWFVRSTSLFLLALQHRVGAGEKSRALASAALSMLWLSPWSDKIVPAPRRADPRSDDVRAESVRTHRGLQPFLHILVTCTGRSYVRILHASLHTRYVDASHSMYNTNRGDYTNTELS